MKPVVKDPAHERPGGTFGRIFKAGSCGIRTPPHSSGGSLAFPSPPLPCSVDSLASQPGSGLKIEALEGKHRLFQERPLCPALHGSTAPSNTMLSNYDVFHGKKGDGDNSHRSQSGEPRLRGIIAQKEEMIT